MLSYIYFNNDPAIVVINRELEDGDMMVLLYLQCLKLSYLQCLKLIHSRKGSTVSAYLPSDRPPREELDH